MNTAVTIDVAAYEAELAQISNRDLVRRISSLITMTATLNSRGIATADDDAKLSALSRESTRRHNPDLYKRGYNDAVRDAGHSGLVDPVSIPVDSGDPTLTPAEES